MEQTFEGPLAGIRIIDLTQVGAGPYCMSMLGDLGADVIKVEPPGGEPMRTVDNHFAPKESAYYFGINRSKRDITINLKSPRGHEILHRLLETADVVAVGMRPQAVESLGIGYDQLADRYPRLVYLSVTAFGETGPRSDEPGMDIVAQALSGVMALTGDIDRPPVKAGTAVADWALSYAAAVGILSALRARDRDGLGQKVSVNLLDAAISLLPNFVTPYFATGTPIRRAGSGHPQIAPYQVFYTADGYMVVGCLSDQFWRPLCEAMERPDLVDHPHFASNTVRVANRDEVVEVVAAEMVKRPTAEWITRFKRSDFPHAPVHELEDVFEDPQVKHNGMLLELDHPRFGPYKAVNNAVKLSRTPARPHGYSPAPGEHSDEILREVGFGDDEIEAFEKDGLN
jgi:crotonobetainyl-CoA:carnitine CoA-transferase CaiB-like acyl-CoA transferase